MFNFDKIIYKTRKITVENLTDGLLTIGDLKITLQKPGKTGYAQNLLYVNPITKRQYRTFEQVMNSTEIKILLTLGKIRLYIDDICVTDVESAIKNLSYSSNYDSTTNKKNVGNLGIISGTVDLDLNSHSAFKFELGENTVLNFINVPKDSSYTFMLVVYQNATESYLLDFPSNVKWDSGQSPETLGVGEIDLYSFSTVDSGDTWFGFQTGNAMA